MRRTMAVLVAVTSVLAGGGPVASAQAAGAPGLVPSARSVAVGGLLVVRPTGCSGVGEQADRAAQVALVVGTGAAARTAAIDFQTGRLSVPGWVDPDEPAFLVGRCIERGYRSAATVFTYPTLPVDVVPGPAGAPSPVVAIGSTTAVGGTLLPVSLSASCGDPTAVVIDPQHPAYPVAFGSGQGEGPVGVALLTDEVLPNDDPDVRIAGRPLPAGRYDLQAVCTSPTFHEAAPGEQMRFYLGAPVSFEIRETRPSDAIGVRWTDAGYRVEGRGCGGGQVVTASVVESTAPPGTGASIVTVVPDAGGGWSIPHPPAQVGRWTLFGADCGDPAAGGFRYAEVSVAPQEADLFVTRTSPGRSPAGGTVAAHVRGTCAAGAAVAMLAPDGAVLSSAPVAFPSGGREATAELVAPPDAGTYVLEPSCAGRRGLTSSYDVFDPTVLAAGAPLPADAADGWPMSAPTESFRGRIGPLVLSPAGTSASGTTGGAISASGPFGASGVTGLVPRPDGEVAITGMRLRLVDEAGREVPPSDAFLRYFVIGDLSSANPACPDGTFGLPSDIVAAAGGEGSSLALPAPYGIVVPGDSIWGASFNVDNRADRSQRLYLTYDLDVRRDVENIRPVQRYFAGARGCSQQTWDLDGTGGEDVQSDFVTMRADGRLIGAEGYLGPGGVAADVVDDRGRRICRSEPITDGSTLGGGRDVAPSSVEGDRPPEFYADDLRILGFGFCSTAERVRAGQRFRIDATYRNDRPRSQVMGIVQLFVWEGGGPPEPGPAASSEPPSNEGTPAAPPAVPRPAHPDYTG